MTQRVLVIDDDPTIMRTLRINLRVRGFVVEAVTNGQDALSAVADAPPDLVVSGRQCSLPATRGESASAISVAASR